MTGKKAKGKGAASGAPTSRGKGFQFLVRLSQLDPDEEHEREELLEAFARISRCVKSYLEHEVATLDEAFQVHRPKRYRRAAERKRYLKRFNVRADAHRLIRAGAPTDKRLFEFVGDLHGLGATLAEEYYYSWKITRPQRGSATPDDLPPKLRAFFNGPR